MKRINIYIDGEQHKALKRLEKRREGSGYSELIRRAISEYIDRVNDVKEARQ